MLDDQQIPPNCTTASLNKAVCIAKHVKYVWVWTLWSYLKVQCVRFTGLQRQNISEMESNAHQYIFISAQSPENKYRVFVTL